MRNPDFNRVVEEILALHDKKNQDYGQDKDPLNNLKGCVRLGDHPTKGIVIRLQDKMSRIENFHLNGNLVNESIRDAHIDAAIYHLLAVVILDEENEAGRTVITESPLTGEKSKQVFSERRIKQEGIPFLDLRKSNSFIYPESPKVEATPSTFKAESRIEEEDDQIKKFVLDEAMKAVIRQVVKKEFDQI
jgi:hypothetical protein